MKLLKPGKMYRHTHIDPDTAFRVIRVICKNRYFVRFYKLNSKELYSDLNYSEVLFIHDNHFKFYVEVGR